MTGYTCHKTSTMFFIVAPHEYLQACVTAKMDKHSSVANKLHPALEQLGWEWNWAWYSISTRSVYVLDINNLCFCENNSKVCAVTPPGIRQEGKANKQTLYLYKDYCYYIFIFLQLAELFSVFSAETTMHPVLKNLGITDKVISFIMESINGNKVK